MSTVHILIPKGGSMLSILLFLAVGAVAFTNGANANFKGCASLYGSGTTSLRRALWWGTVTTFAGSVAAIWLSHGLLQRFSGRGIVPQELLQRPQFAAAVALGGAATSFLATRLAFPVSTTHALLGALVGAGLAGGGEVQFQALLKSLVAPLLFSPGVALWLGAVVYWTLRRAHLAPEHRSPLLDTLHFASTGGASFARGLNDTPKMAALLLASPDVNLTWGFVAVAVAIALGGLLDADRVAETLGRRVTDMNPGQGFAASLVTAGLVSTASLHGLPVSTTHVSVGALLGMGTVTGRAHWRTAAEIALAWLCTVPCGAVLAAFSYTAMSWLSPR